MDVNLSSNTGLPTLNNDNTFLVANPAIIIVLLAVIILYSLLFSSLGNSSQDIPATSNNQVNFLGIIVLCIFIVLVLINGMNYFLNVNIITSLKDMFLEKPRVDIDIKYDEDNVYTIKEHTLDTVKSPELSFSKQVYHVPGNKYTYKDAKAICKATGNRLATYKEIEDAYNNGGDWCSYGWSANQLALFPTQHDKWSKLQHTDDHKNDCGRPGINGGFIDNENVRFGVNCYGYKPKMSALESELMDDIPLYPKTQKEENFDKRVSYWKSRINDILVAPFNNKNWDMSLF